MCLSLDERMRLRNVIKLYTLRVYEYAVEKRSAIRGHRANPTRFAQISPTRRNIINKVRNPTGPKLAHAAVTHSWEGRTGWPEHRESRIGCLKAAVCIHDGGFEQPQQASPRRDYPRKQLARVYGTINTR